MVALWAAARRRLLRGRPRSPCPSRPVSAARWSFPGEGGGAFFVARSSRLDDLGARANFAKIRTLFPPHAEYWMSSVASPALPASVLLNLFPGAFPPETPPDLL